MQNVYNLICCFYILFTFIFKHKYRIYHKKVYIIRDDKSLTKIGNKKKSITVVQNQIVYYSEKYVNK